MGAETLDEEASPDAAKTSDRKGTAGLVENETNVTSLPVRTEMTELDREIKENFDAIAARKGEQKDMRREIEQVTAALTALNDALSEDERRAARAKAGRYRDFSREDLWKVYSALKDRELEKHRELMALVKLLAERLRMKRVARPPKRRYAACFPVVSLNIAPPETTARRCETVRPSRLGERRQRALSTILE